MYRNLTALGRLASKFPLDPALAVMLISSPEFECSKEILSITALLSVPQIFVRPAGFSKWADKAKKQFAHPDGDHLTMLNVYHAFKSQPEPVSWCHENFLSYESLSICDSVRAQLEGIMLKNDIPLISTQLEDKKYNSNIRRALCAGFFMRVAKKIGNGKSYSTVKDNHVRRC